MSIQSSRTRWLAILTLIAAAYYCVYSHSGFHVFYKRPADSVKSVFSNISGARVLVTGGAGFIGHHVIMRLKKEGIYVIGIDNFNDYYDVRLKRKRSEISSVVIDMDVCDDVTKLLESHQVTHVIHLAAQAGVRYSLTNPQAYVRSNVECFVKLLETLKNTGLPLVYASSSSVYGQNTKVPFSEDDPVEKPISLYAATKRENELLAYVYWNLYQQRSIGLRFFTVYGPLGRPDMAYYTFTKNILENKTISVFNHGKLSRDFTYVDDVVDGVLACLHINYDHEIINIGRGEPHPLMEFIGVIEASLGRKADMVFEDMAKGDVVTTYADISKARHLLGYNPKVGLREGIGRFTNWYKENIYVQH